MMDDLPTAGQRQGLLQTRLHAPTAAADLLAERHILTFGGRSAELFDPGPKRAAAPRPLIIVLHGATGIDGGLVDAAMDRARIGRAFVIAPRSAGTSWDLMRGGYGADVAFIDHLLEWAVARLAVEPERLCIAGFSDGASYALSLGLTNGHLFREVLAFSPGFMAPGPRVGRPRIFISHGRRDRILPIERCGRRLAAELKREGYDVDYREFDGDHVVPAAVADAGMHRFLSE